MALLEALQNLMRPQIEQATALNNNAVAPVQAGVSQGRPVLTQPNINRAPSVFEPMQSGGGRFVTEDNATFYDGQGFSPKPEEPWYKRAMNDPTLMARLAMGFNTMRLNPDQGLNAMLGDRIKTAGEIGRQNKTAEQVAVALKNQGRFQEAALIEANPDMAKTVLSAMFTGDRAKNFTFMSGAQLNTAQNTTVFDPKKPYKVSSTGEISEIGGGGTNVSVSLGNEAGKSFINRSDEFVKTALASGNILASADTMLGLLDEGVSTGFGQETMLSIQQGLQLFNPDYQIKDIAGKEAFLAESVRAILPQVKQLGVNPTDADLKFISSGSATLGKSVEGNKLMLKGIKLKAQRDQYLGSWVSDWEINNQQLLSSSPMQARAKFNKDLITLQRTSPLFTQAGQMLRQEFQALTKPPANPARATLENGGFINRGANR
jgi:hypothetical protein